MIADEKQDEALAPLAPKLLEGMPFNVLSPIPGMAELVGYGLDIPRARIDTLCAATRALFPRSGLGDALQPWAGLRPATPTGLPVVGRHARAPANLLLNTGHGALGFTLAFGTAAAVAEALAG